MDRKLQYLIIFIVILIIFIFFTCYQKEEFIDIKKTNNKQVFKKNIHKNKLLNKKNMEGDISDIKKTLNTYIKEVRSLEHTLKTRGLLDDDLIKIGSLPHKDDYSLFYTKSIDDSIDIDKDKDIDKDVHEDFISFGKKLSNFGKKAISTISKNIPKSVKDQFKEDSKKCDIKKLDDDQQDKLQISKELPTYIKLAGTESITNNINTSF